MRTRLVVAMSAIAVLGAARPLSAAGPFELTGFNPRNKSMAGAQTAIADDYTATFYNPALLATRHSLNFGAALSVVYPNTTIALEQQLAEDSPYQPELPGFEGGAALGFDFPVGGKIGDRLAIGLGVYLPATEVARIRTLDPMVPQFYLWESGMGRLEVMPAVAVRWFDWLTTGVGIRATGGLIGPTRFQVDPVAGTESHREFDTALKYQIAPTMGIALGPLFGLRLGGVYRGALGMPIDFPSHIGVDGTDIEAEIRFGSINIYSPHTISIGAAYTFLDNRITLSVDLQYLRWSDAPDPSVQFGIDTSGNDLDRLGIGDSLDIPAPGLERTVVPGFQDTLVPRAGLEFFPVEFLAVRCGYFYRPTPLPNQTSGSNYVDNNTHGLTSGVGLTFQDPLEAFANPITIDASAQVLILAERSARKDDASDPVGNWKAGGQIFDFAIAVTYSY